MAYFVPDEQLEQAIMDAARRGVSVRMVLPSYSDFSGVFYAGRAHYDELLEAVERVNRHVARLLSGQRNGYPRGLHPRTCFQHPVSTRCVRRRPNSL